MIEIIKIIECLKPGVRLAPTRHINDCEFWGAASIRVFGRNQIKFIWLVRSFELDWVRRDSSDKIRLKFKLWTKSVQTGEISEWTPNWDHWKHCLSKCKWLIMNFLSSESEPQIRRSARQWNFSLWNSGLLELIISIFITFCQALPDFRLSRFVRLSRFAQAPVWQNRITIWGFEYHEALRDASMMPSR